ncbi:hypothetical protein PoB_004038600 [Plakobranchus ocellatus]|uniref:Uncharacterized protein n=1 Tax=Plakobranchus ocellatus TaxID=259542 RepID=A0AAV4B033_9GAST|nr:hypothetical protein PoB_004038600 [Plakobranchus ocellatus]
MFGHLKRHLGGMAFETEDDLISELRNWFDNLDVDFFRPVHNRLSQAFRPSVRPGRRWQGSNPRQKDNNNLKAKKGSKRIQGKKIAGCGNVDHEITMVYFVCEEQVEEGVVKWLHEVRARKDVENV